MKDGVDGEGGSEVLMRDGDGALSPLRIRGGPSSRCEFWGGRGWETGSKGPTFFSH